jgi:hypothetical protein
MWMSTTYHQVLKDSQPPGNHRKQKTHLRNDCAADEFSFPCKLKCHKICHQSWMWKKTGKGKRTHFVGNLLEELFFVELYKVARFLPLSVLQGTNQSGGPWAVSPELLLLGWNLGLEWRVMSWFCPKYLEKVARVLVHTFPFFHLLILLP